MFRERKNNNSISHKGRGPSFPRGFYFPRAVGFDGSTEYGTYLDTHGLFTKLNLCTSVRLSCLVICYSADTTYVVPGFAICRSYTLLELSDLASIL